jgi:hypothetical protein
MRRQVELYISDREINPQNLLEIPYYQRMDLFEEESINITMTIKDAKDIAKLFTDYSQQFNLPASRNNNKIFKHYYNFDIDNGFDARVKRDALIKINGEDYRIGFISLNDVSMKKQQPFSYKVVFYGKTINMKRLFGDDELSSLPDDVGSYLNAFNHPYSNTIAQQFFTAGKNKAGVGLQPNIDLTGGDICYPFVSGKSHYYYDSGSNAPSFKTDTPSRNVKTSGNNKGLSMVDFKPAIRVCHIIKAIEEKYNITFTTDFFAYDDSGNFGSNINNAFYYLYLWLHREAGDLATQIGESELSINLSQYTFTNTSPTGNADPRSGTNNKDLVSSITGTTSGQRTWVYYKYIVTVTPVGGVGSTYSLEMLDSQTGKTINPASVTTNLDGGATGSTTATFVIAVNQSSLFPKVQVFTPILKVKTVGGITAITINSLKIEKYTDEILSSFTGTPTTISTSHYDANYTITNPDTSNSRFSVSSGISMSANMPKIKVIDFLMNIFKMFNLVAFFDDRRILPNGNTNTDFGKIKVMTLDDFYSEGVNYDITEYLYTDKHSVSKANIYSEINFNYSDPSTFAIIHSNEITGDEFGNERLNNRSDEIDSPLAFDGGKYDVDIGFEHIMFERMSDQSGDEELTTIQSGWMVSEDENPVLSKPLVFYCHKHFTTSEYEMKTTDNTTITSYIRPANTLTTSTTNLQSIHFGEEDDEYFYPTNLPNGESLFTNYYSRYVTAIYDNKSRLSKFKATLPAKIITKLKLNDRLIISGKKYKINKIKLNINTGKADLELMNEVL